MDLVLLDREEAALEVTADAAREHGSHVQTIVGDVTDADVCRSLVDAAMSTHGRLDVLVNNVGIFGPEDDLPGVELASWGRAMHINVTAMALTARFAVPAMASAGGGAIVNLTSIAALAGTGGAALFYATSKGAVLSMTRHLASRYGRDGIRVNCVAPGMVDTPMVAGRASPEVRERMRVATPLRRTGTAWDVAEAVAFLAGPKATWISGIVLPVDGGLMAAVPSTEGAFADELGGGPR